MQSMPITTAMLASGGNSIQVEGVGNNGTAGEGLDFSALLKVQIKGAKGVRIPAETLPVAAITEPVLADVSAQQALKSLPGMELKPQADAVPAEDLISLLEGQQATKVMDALEATLDNNLAPQAGGFLPVQVAVSQQPLPLVSTSVSLGRAPEGIKSRPDDLLQFERGIPAGNVASSDFGREAEIAVDGKLLPQGRVEKNEEIVKLPILSAESPRAPEVPASALSPMLVTHHASVIETKSLSPSPANTLQTPVGTAGWSDALGQKVVWMAGQQTQVAELHLNPPNLGPMEVRLSLSNDQVSAIFVSHQPAVREAIEAAMPRLREMLADSGMTLGNATVSSDSLPQQQPSGREGQPGSSHHSDFSELGNMYPSQNLAGMIPLRQDGSGMVDLFA